MPTKDPAPTQLPVRPAVPGQPAEPVKGSPVNDLMEWLGFVALVAFFYFVWPPAALAAAGVILVVASNLRDARRNPNRARLVDRVARALAAYQSAGGDR